MSSKTSPTSIILEPAEYHSLHSYLLVLIDSQCIQMLLVQRSWVSQLFAHCVSISATETFITHSAPLSIAVHLHQTLISEVSPSESYHTIIWVVPKMRSGCNYSKKIAITPQLAWNLQHHNWHGIYITTTGVETHSRWQRHHRVHWHSWSQWRCWRSTAESPGIHWRSSPHHPVW